MTNSSDADAEIRHDIICLTVAELLDKSASCCEDGLVLHIMCKACHQTIVTVGE